MVRNLNSAHIPSGKEKKRGLSCFRNYETNTHRKSDWKAPGSKTNITDFLSEGKALRNGILNKVVYIFGTGWCVLVCKH